MKILIAIGVIAPSSDESWFTEQDYHSLFEYEVVDHTALLASAVEDALRASELAEPAESGEWWLAHVSPTDSGSLRIQPATPTPGYGIDDRGRLLMDFGFRRLTVAEYLRAVDEGYYPSRRHDVVVVPPPAAGGNGFIAQTILEWFAQNAGAVLLAYLGGRGIEHVGQAEERRIQQLAKDWAAQRIESPFQLRQWIDRRGEWFPAELAQRLSLNEPAAVALLRALGYEENQLGLMQRRSTEESLQRRNNWLLAEHGEFLEQFDPEGWEAGLLHSTPGRSSRPRRRLRQILRRKD